MQNANSQKRKRASFPPGLLANAFFYLGVPVCLGLCFGISKTPFGGQFSITFSIAIWVTNILIFWSAAGLATAALEQLSHRMKLEAAPILTLVAGGLLGKLISLWPREITVEFVLGLGGYSFNREIQTIGEAVGAQNSLDMMVVVLNSLILPIVYWVTARLLFLRATNRLGFWGETDSKLGETAQTTRIGIASPIVRSPQDIKKCGHLIVALRSEQNYVRVIFENTETLVRMTMHEAVSALDEIDGMQVHRSYWVNFRYIDKLKKNGRKKYLICTNGHAVPMSDAKYAVLKHDERFCTRESDL